MPDFLQNTLCLSCGERMTLTDSPETPFACLECDSSWQLCPGCAPARLTQNPIGEDEFCLICAEATAESAFEDAAWDAYRKSR